MKQAAKKICAVVMFFCVLALSISSSIETYSAKKSTEKTVYAAFGDSIAAGYGLEGYSSSQKKAPADSYQALFAAFLKTTSRNHAITGDDTNDCIQLLNSGSADADLKNADVISLSIGSNDLLKPFLKIVMEYFDIDSDTIDSSMFENGFTMPQIDMASIIKYYQQSEALIADLENNALLHAQTAAFPEKLQKILSILHKKAPSAEIYVTNIYNPFQEIPMIGTMAETYIQEMNKAFSAKSSDYILVDLHTPFQESGLTNVCFDLTDLTAFNLDPHPSKAGHKLIADRLIAAAKKVHAPKAASLRSLQSDKNYKLTAKLNLPADADGYQIRYASSKNGTYQTLASNSQKTFRTNSAKLKSKKKYYIKVRSFKTIKGVIYYGKTSAAKAVKIK